MRARFSVFLYFLCHKLTIANRTCYWPDGSVISSSFDYSPCNLTATGIENACCSSVDPCSANGYCFGSAGYLYRGGCTDSTWSADDCCPSCRDVSMNSFSNVIPCPLVDGSYTKSFCCSDNPDASCCDRTFSLNVISGPGRSTANDFPTVSQLPSTKLSSTITAPILTGRLAVASSIPASSTSASIPASSTLASISASSTPGSALPAVATSQQSPPSKKNVEIGVAIGVSLGVSLISGLIFFLFHERKLRIKAQRAVVDTLAAYDEIRATIPPAGSYETQGQSRPQELEDTQPQPGELYDGELHEADLTI